MPTTHWCIWAHPPSMFNYVLAKVVMDAQRAEDELSGWNSELGTCPNEVTR